LFIFIVLKFFKADAYGYYSYIFSYATLFNNFFAGWINQGQLRRANKTNDTGDQKILLYYGIAVSCTLALIAASVYYLIMHEAVRSVLLLLMTIVISMHFLLLNYFQAKFQARVYRKVEIFRSVVLLAMICLFALVFPLKPELVAVCVILVYLSSILYASLSVEKGMVKMSRSFLQENKKFMLGIFRFAFPVTLWLTVMNLFPVIDRSILSAHAGMGRVGVYTSLYDIVIRSFSLVYFPITAFIHPRFMSSVNNEVHTEAKQILNNGIRHFVLLFAGVVLVVVVAYNLGLLGRFLHEDISLKLVLYLITAGSLWQFALLLHKPLEAKNRTLQMFGQIVIALAVYVTILLLRDKMQGFVDYDTLGLAFMISAAVYCALSLPGYIKFLKRP
jgi:O-antigen/teichoic acid export membrane protein